MNPITQTVLLSGTYAISGYNGVDAVSVFQQLTAAVVVACTIGLYVLGIVTVRLAST